MTNKKEKYDPAIYGQLRAKFLKELDYNIEFTDFAQEEETRRKEIMRDIREKKLVIIK